MNRDIVIILKIPSNKVEVYPMSRINEFTKTVIIACHILLLLSDRKIRKMSDIHEDVSELLVSQMDTQSDQFYYTCSQIMTTYLRDDLGYISSGHGFWKISESGLSFLQQMRTP